MSEIISSKTYDIREKLFAMQDIAYRDFSAKLLPTLDADAIIGVRTPALRKLARELPSDEKSNFLNSLPHRYFEENQLHAFAVSMMGDFNAAMHETEKFLPYIDNWATCDQFSPGIFAKQKEKLLSCIREWIVSNETYIVRFGIVMMMRHFLDDDFEPGYLAEIAAISSSEYYVQMAIAWYFATALAKQYDVALPYIENNMLDETVHNKAIQKARESRRVEEKHKEYLTTLRRRAE